MIRGLLLLLLFVTGLAAAALFQGRMHHLRLAVPDRLPPWTESLAADAGLRTGAMDLPARGPWPATRLTWSARMPTRAGWLWDVTLAGDGVALTGLMALAFAADSAVLSDVTGSLDIGSLAPAPLPVQGIARIEALTGVTTGLRDTPIVTGALEARVATLTLDGADFGAGPLVAYLADTGNWQAELTLGGGVSPVQATLAGDLTQSTAQLDAQFADGPALPATLRAMLAAAGQADGQGWRLAIPVPLR